MGRKATEININEITKMVKQGLHGVAIAKKLGVNYYTLLDRLKANNTSVMSIKKAQDKAWDTMKKNKLVDDYNSATSSGIKAGIARKFNTIYGISIKEYIATKNVPTKTKSGVGLREQIVELLIPTQLKKIIDEQNRRIEQLEKLLLNK